MKRVRKPMISQSLIKDLEDYRDGKLCGKQFEAKHILGIRFPSSDAQKLGQYFEYIATGARNRHGEIPEPEKTQKGELTAKYKLIHEQAENFKRMMDHYGFRIISEGLTLKYKRFTGILDLVIEFTKEVRTKEHLYPAGTVAIMDLKTSGLLEDKWNEFGWYTEAIPGKHKIHLQATHYKWLFLKKLKKDVPFFFAVFSNTNGQECKIIEMIPGQYWIELHEEKLRVSNELLTKKMKEAAKNKEYTALPNPLTCSKCAIKSTCTSFVDFPLIESVHYANTTY